MFLTRELFLKAVPNLSEKNADKYLPALQIVAQNFGIDTPLRMAHFLAQIGHETLSFFYYREIASGASYEGRKDLGNTMKGDGIKFKGRGAIQVTGRANYRECSLFLFNDTRLIDFPELLELPENSIKAACWFWQKNSLNVLADKNDIIKITKKINGGTNGMLDRTKRLNYAKKAFAI